MTSKLLTLGAAALFLQVGCAFHASGRAGMVAPPPPSATVTATVTAAPPPPAVVAVQVGQPTVDSNVTVIEATCVQGGEEQCNGLDDNCNGQIDEGCGYSSGQIQITLGWSSGADVDLYVTDPAGEEISYSHPQAASGGHLDHDARGECRRGQPHNTIENVYWQSTQPPSGTYQVALHYWGECNSNAGPTMTTLSISVGGQIIGQYSYQLSPNEKVTIASFDIP